MVYLRAASLALSFFNIAVNDLPDNITGIQISQYADDIALWKSNRNVQFLEKRLKML